MKQAAFTFNFLVSEDDGDTADDDEKRVEFASREQQATEQESTHVPVLARPNSSAIISTRATTSRPFRWVDDVSSLLEERSREELVYKEIPVVTKGLSIPEATTPTVFLRVVDLNFSSYYQKPKNDGDKDDDVADLQQQQHIQSCDTTTTTATADIVTGVYEGGAKVWECSLDLVDYLARTSSALLWEENERTGAGAAASRPSRRPRKVWEIGCGHGLPGCFLLRQWLVQDHQKQQGRRSDAIEDEPSSSFSSSSLWSITFSDYNEEVILDATISNIVLNAQIGILPAGDDDDDDTAIITVPDVAPHVRLGAGDWLDQSAHMMTMTTMTNQPGSGGGGGEMMMAPEPFDLILAAETLYTAQACRDTAALLRRHLRRHDDDDGGAAAAMALIATKRYYFGVGGGVDCFRSHCAATDLCVETVQVVDHGSGNIREILKVTIAPQ